MKPLGRLLLLCAVACGLAVSLASPASAHRNDESYLYLDIGDSDLRGSVQLPYGDVRSVLGLELVGPVDEVRAEIAAQLDRLQTYAADRTSLGADGERWQLDFEGFELLNESDVESDGLGYVILPYVASLPNGEVPQLIDVTFTPFLDEIPDRNNIALISNYWETGVIGEESNELVFFDADSRSGVIDLENPSQWKNFNGSIELGVDHIRTGPDHIFFILALLLPSVLVVRHRRWWPAPRFRTALWRILIVASMFTIAHSVTFTLAGLDLIPLPPSKFTETLIAASIVVAALFNLRPMFGRRDWLIAFVFGLFHGLGFAAFVDDLEITQTTKMVSLLGRNVGIEIGQAVIVLMVFPALFILSRTRSYRVLMQVTSVVLAGVASVWVIERLTEGDYGFNARIDQVVEWPRSLAVCVLLTLVAGSYYAWARSKGNLEPLPPVEEEQLDDEPVSV